MSWADTRWTRSFKTPGEASREMLDFIKGLRFHGKPITMTRVDAGCALPEQFPAMEFYEPFRLNLAISISRARRSAGSFSHFLRKVSPIPSRR